MFLYLQFLGAEMRCVPVNLSKLKVRMQLLYERIYYCYKTENLDLVHNNRL